MVSVPNVELAPGFDVKSRWRFGSALDGTEPSSSGAMIPDVSRRMGEARFSGPGAPSRCVTPEMNVPCVSAKWKSPALSLVSFGLPGVEQPTPLTKSHCLRK
jgi:hypothetical protein